MWKRSRSRLKIRIQETERMKWRKEGRSEVRCCCCWEVEKIINRREKKKKKLTKAA